MINIILKSKDSGFGSSTLFGQTGEGDGETAQVSPYLGLPLSDGGHIHLSADARIQQRTDRGTPNRTTFYFPVNGAPDPREATVDRHVNHPGQPHVKSTELAYDMGLPVGESFTFYSFATGSARDADSWLTFRNPNASNNNVAVYPDGVVPRLLVRNRDFQVAAGIKDTDLQGFNWDFSTTYGRDQVKYKEFTALNASLGPDSPTTFYTGSLTSHEWTTNLDLNRYVDTGVFARPLFSAAGLEYRKNRYTVGAGEPASFAC